MRITPEIVAALKRAVDIHGDGKQCELEQKAGLTPSTIHRYVERKCSHISHENWLKLEPYLNLPLPSAKQPVPAPAPSGIDRMDRMLLEGFHRLSDMNQISVLACVCSGHVKCAEESPPDFPTSPSAPAYIRRDATAEPIHGRLSLSRNQSPCAPDEAFK
jgi:hypothetical protein